MLDTTSWRVFVQKHEKRIRAITLGIMIFGVGWYAGRVTSPYFTSTPIVFEDRECSACASSRGNAQQLQDLAREDMDDVGRKGSENGVVAGMQSDTQLIYVSSVNSDLYHHNTCPSAKRINEENRRWFATQEQARAAGLEPSKCTQERNGE